MTTWINKFKKSYSVEQQAWRWQGKRQLKKSTLSVVAQEYHAEITKYYRCVIMFAGDPSSEVAWTDMQTERGQGTAAPRLVTPNRCPASLCNAAQSGRCATKIWWWLFSKCVRALASGKSPVLLNAFQTQEVASMGDAKIENSKRQRMRSIIKNTALVQSRSRAGAFFMCRCRWYNHRKLS